MTHVVRIAANGIEVRESTYNKEVSLVHNTGDAMYFAKRSPSRQAFISCKGPHHSRCRSHEPNHREEDERQQQRRESSCCSPRSSAVHEDLEKWIPVRRFEHAFDVVSEREENREDHAESEEAVDQDAAESGPGDYA
jgi:hypothetical protein